MLNRLIIYQDGTSKNDLVSYDHYFSVLQDKDKKQEKKKDSYHTFLVFASGSIIMSSKGPDMKNIFYELVSILVKNRDLFEEPFEPEKKVKKSTMTIIQ